MWKKNLFGSSQDLEMLNGLRMENVFKLLLTLKPLTGFRILGVFLVYRLCYPGFDVSLN